MNPVLLSFADGTVFFVGIAMLLIAVSVLFARQRWLRAAFTVCALVGMILVVLSSTPLPVWLYAVWLMLSMSCVVCLNGFTRLHTVRRWLSAGLLFVSVAMVAMVAMELRYRSAPEVSLSPDTVIYVLGDSISAGISHQDTPWPLVLETLSDFRVVNCAHAGATVDGAIEQAKQIPEIGAFVIIEIGGNDLLGDTSASDFYERLDRLVASLVPEHQVLLVELPLFPLQNAYGQAQRRVADRHGVSLLPKRYFTHVLGLPESTSDGLHLSPRGHTAMAEVMLSVLAPE